MVQFCLPAFMIFGLTLVCGYFILPILREHGMGQRVRQDGPQTHLAKSGTPTLGALFFVLPATLVFLLRLLLVKGWDTYAPAFLLAFCFGLVGFADDFTKVRIDPNGLSVKQKSIIMGLLSLGFAVYYVYLRPTAPYIRLPFGGGAVEISGGWKLVYLVFITLYLFYMANAVNLSDGLDGLCSSLVFCSGLTLAIALFLLDEQAYAPLIELALVLAAGVLGFLFFNRHPALVFMGDTGSLYLGAGLAVITLLAGVPWIMLLNGLVFIVEGLSSLLQTFYFKLTKGKRLFRMAPLHHHFELGGWSEVKIVRIFSLVGLACGLLALVII